MKKKKKVVIKIYQFQDLLKLAVDDIRRKHGNHFGDIHWVVGGKGSNAYIRVDATPLDLTEAGS